MSVWGWTWHRQGLQQNKEGYSVRTILLPVQHIDDNNSKKDVIFSWIFKHKQSQRSLQSVSGIYLWGKSDQAICCVLQGFTICDRSSHSKQMPRKPFGLAHCCGLCTLPNFLNTEGLILNSLETILCGNNCSVSNEIAPCTHQNKCKKGWTDHRNSFLKFSKRLCFCA